MIFYQNNVTYYCSCQGYCVFISWTKKKKKKINYSAAELQTYQSTIGAGKNAIFLSKTLSVKGHSFITETDKHTQ